MPVGEPIGGPFEVGAVGAAAGFLGEFTSRCDAWTGLCRINLQRWPPAKMRPWDSRFAPNVRHFRS
jgi:hypothetical protein